MRRGHNGTLNTRHAAGRANGTLSGSRRRRMPTAATAAAATATAATAATAHVAAKTDADEDALACELGRWVLSAARATRVLLLMVLSLAAGVALLWVLSLCLEAMRPDLPPAPAPS